MIKITLPDGAIKEVAKGSSPFEVAKSISEGLARNVISAKFNETIVESTTPLNEDGSLTLYTWNNDCLLYTSPSPRDQRGSRMPSSA